MKKSTKIMIESLVLLFMEAAVMMWVWNHVISDYFAVPVIGYGPWLLINMFLGAVIHSPLQTKYLKEIMMKLRGENTD